MGYSFWLAARVLLYASSHRQDNTYHSLYYTIREALAGTRNSSIAWRIDPTTHCTMSKRSYHGATSRSLTVIIWRRLLLRCSFQLVLHYYLVCISMLISNMLKFKACCARRTPAGKHGLKFNSCQQTMITSNTDINFTKTYHVDKFICLL